MKSPLLIWKFLVPPVVLALFFLVLVRPATFEDLRRAGMFASQLDHVRFEKNEAGVLILGNSLLQHAMPPDRVISARFNAEILKETGKPGRIRAYKIAVPGLPTSELKKSREKILATRPKIVILQTELVFPNYAVKDPPKNFEDWFQMKTDQMREWSRLVKVYISPSLAQTNIPAKTKKLLGAVKSNAIDSQTRQKAIAQDFQTQRLEWLWSKRKVNRNAPDYVMCREFIDEAHAAGIRVAVLDMPVSSRTLTIAPKNYLEERSSAIQEILGPSDFYLRYPKSLPDSYFFDYSHLTVRGRSTFFRWTTRTFAQNWKAGF